jgi:hypothetical protein
MFTLRRLASAALLAIMTAAWLFSQTTNSDSAHAIPTGKVQQIAGLPAAAQQAMAAVEAQRIRAHVRFLASDLLEGRGTGQRGGDIAAEYLATQFALYGLKPAGDNGTYMQKVPL